MSDVVHTAEDQIPQVFHFIKVLIMLRAIGDGAGVTRGLQQASANGLCVARSIIKTLMK